jgi:hypothetical protein
LVADDGVAAPGGDQIAGEGRQGFGQFDGDGPELECDGVVAGVDSSMVSRLMAAGRWA